MVTDNGYPQPNTDSVRVNIQVERGQVPQWQPDEIYYATVNEGDPNGTYVQDIEATKPNPLVRFIKNGKKI